MGTAACVGIVAEDGEIGGSAQATADGWLGEPPRGLLRVVILLLL